MAEQESGLFIGAGAFIDLMDKVDGIGKKLDKRDPAVYQTDILFSPITASNLVDDPALLAPITDVCWGIRRLTCAGFTAGTVTVQVNQLEPIQFPNPGMYTFGRGVLLLQHGDRLTIQPNAITGTATLFGKADVFPFWFLKEYLA
ncbi:MAG TPA: hypothetical protein VGR89_03105 [Puia sp.]|nr:hypothetical protein [Puia sp.]